ncbi:MAG: hypothetical protein JNK77_14680 [Saprospiraceae bacterium]|nr:hypothetical protein [Saprospiraceae bacterium]
MPNNKSSHILNTSSNLLGICFIVLTALRVQDLRQASVIDEITTFSTILFMTSCVFSFLSLRTTSSRGIYYERVADVFFLIGLISMFLLIMIISFNVI